MSCEQQCPVEQRKHPAANIRTCHSAPLPISSIVATFNHCPFPPTHKPMQRQQVYPSDQVEIPLHMRCIAQPIALTSGQATCCSPSVPDSAGAEHNDCQMHWLPASTLAHPAQRFVPIPQRFTQECGIYKAKLLSSFVIIIILAQVAHQVQALRIRLL